MPSPFPGMDPHIEGQRWRDFHTTFIVALREALVPHVRPRYVVEVEERLYLEHSTEDQPKFIIPDAMVLEPPSQSPPPPAGGVATLVTIEPVMLTLPMPHQVKERFLTLRDRESDELVTVIEVLSPTNKRVGSDGRRKYLSKRRTVLSSPVHLVELDLLRGGERLPTNEPLPPADYYAFVCRRRGRPRVAVYPWTLRHPLPTIPIPLAGDDPDVPLNIQAVFTTAFDRAGYDYSIRRGSPIQPPLSEADAAWAEARLKSGLAPPTDAE